MSLMSKVKKKLKSGSWYPGYRFMFRHLAIHPRRILLESRHGQDLDSNIYALLRELSDPRYARFHVTLSIRRHKEAEILSRLQAGGIPRPHIVHTGSPLYYLELSRAGYLVNDTSFPGRFLKKDGQVWVNVWHGTPLKKMGRDNLSERVVMGNVLRNLLLSDYLIFPNQVMENRMSQAYMLDGLYKGTVLHAGYPRNDVFFDSEKALARKGLLGLMGKRVLAYMPTYRGLEEKTDPASLSSYRTFLEQMDDLLSEEECLLVHLHPFEEQKLDLGSFSHIRSFPQPYDLYETLSACDVLITDYSSVCFDFANSGKTIILYPFDREEYEAQRGFYEALEDLPFPVAASPREVLAYSRKESVPLPQAYRDKYLTWEDGKGCQALLSRVLFGDKRGEEVSFQGSGRPKILLYGGDLARNGITTALRSLYAQLPKDVYDFYLSFRMDSLKEDPSRLSWLEADALLFPMASEMNMDIITSLAQAIYLKYGFSGLGIGKRLEGAYREEWKKHFGETDFQYIVHYNGYENYTIQLFLSSGVPCAIWAHNDMVREMETKHYPNRFLLARAYREMDKVAGVSRDAAASVTAISGRREGVLVIPNCQEARLVREKAKLPLSFDPGTRSMLSAPQLLEILEDPASVCFINIGRFSPEKGHAQLIEAFTGYWKDHPQTWLIILGGAGGLFEETLRLAKASPAGEHILVIFGMSNPMPLLKRCDLFILSSLYEGLGLALLEADFLNVPCISTDVPGARELMGEYGGFLVPSSSQGLREGMEAFSRGEVSPMHIDYSDRNRQSLEAFLGLIDKCGS